MVIGYEYTYQMPSARDPKSDFCSVESGGVNPKP